MIISYQLLQSFLSFPIGLSPSELADRLTQQGLEVERFLPSIPKTHLALGKVIRVENGISVAIHLETQEEVSITAVLEKDCRYVLDRLQGSWEFSTPARFGWSSHTTPLWVPSGLTIEQAWEFDDIFIELSITPNRGDCLSYVGLAREVALAQRKPFSKKVVLQQFKDRYKVVWDGPTQLSLQVDPTLSSLYAVAKVYCPTRFQSPFWLQRFLLKHGLIGKMPSVDLSQYLMLVFGHPTHAFDYGAIGDQIEVGFKTFAMDREFVALDSKKMALPAGVPTPMISSSSGQLLAMPGLIGSLDSAAQSDSRDLLLEAAFFEPSPIRTLRKHGLVTDSSLRFERGVDREGQADLLDIFCGMLQSMHPQVLCWSPQVLGEKAQSPIIMSSTFAKLQALAGVHLQEKEIATVLELLGGSLEAGQLSCPTPSWRFDLPLEQNFLSEVLRAYGIDRLTLPPSDRANSRKIVCEEPTLAPWLHKGFTEVVTYSFGPKAWALIGCEESKVIEVKNPLNQDFSVMRTSVWPSLLNVLASNLRHGGSGLGVVELAPIYHKDLPMYQKKVVSAALYCNKPTPSWNFGSKTSTEWSYYAIKGLVAQLGLKVPVSWEPLTSSNPYLHPALSAQLVVDGRVVGLIGLIHPELAQSFEWPQAWLLQLDADLWIAPQAPSFKPLSRYQKVQRDFSFLCPQGVHARDVLRVLKENVQYCVSMEVFDYYQPENGDPTLGIHVVFQKMDQTLEDFEVQALVNKALDALRNTLGVVLKS